MASMCCVMAQRCFISADPLGGPAIGKSVGLGGANVKTDVQLVQSLLNLVAPIALAPKPLLNIDGLVGPLTIGAIKQFQSRTLGLSDGRVDPGGPTFGRLSVLAYQAGGPAAFTGNTVRQVSQVTAAPPPPSPKPTPLEAATAAAPRAQLWTSGAITHVTGLEAAIIATGGVVFLPEVLTTVNTHFHLDKDQSSILVNLGTIKRVFVKIGSMLSNMSQFVVEGPENDKSHWADAPVGGFDEPGKKFTVRTQFPNVGPMCQAAMLVHEGAHFCGGGGANGVIHFAHEFPLPNGSPQDSGTHNYVDMPPSEAIRNAASYAAFAIHASFPFKDERFGLDRPSV
jgi:peptidoglycan hydrolase-like protein with peptidoglycan-binding domain